ncbi:hypothetical protein COU57_04435 [Candidatus Pacearchaeota archaeon CG10_big_fil_rev_8_21_14_0_10_32_14]|nr:MAG: hypothetical protein COU57_04435 [Candidatus Pacearchaeota archaeon CG10_big_fil_rev_8_21_14_0_10_32_14]
MEIKVEIPEDLKFIENVSNLEWNILVSKMLKVNLENISQLKKNLSHSSLTEKDVEEFTNKINISLSKRYN